MAFFSLGLNAQHISASDKPISGDIYHLGGKIGIGTIPQTLLHLEADHNLGEDFPIIRLQNVYPKSELENIWDIRNQETLYFDFQGESPLSTKMLISPTGQLALGTESPHSSAILHVASTEKGALLPKMTTAQMNAISSPAWGLIVYNTEQNAFMYHDNGTWFKMFTETDFLSTPAAGITQQDTSNWNTAFSWGNHADSNYLTTANFELEMDNYLALDSFANHPVSEITENDTLNWNTAFGWGNHTDSNYLTTANFELEIQNFLSLDSFANHPVSNITENDIANWNTTTETHWLRNGNKTYLKNQSDKVGFGTTNPMANLHIYNNEKMPQTNLKFENREGKENPFLNDGISKTWELINTGNSFNLAYGESELLNPETETLFTFTKEGNLGIGTTSPTEKLQINLDKTTEKQTAIRMQKNTETGGGGSGTKGNTHTWDIELQNANLNFCYGINENQPETKISLSSGGKITANSIKTAKVEFDGLYNINQNGQEIEIFSPNFTVPNTNIKIGGTNSNPAINILPNGNVYIPSLTTDNETWQTNSEGINYNEGNVGIGTDQPQTHFNVNNGAILISGGASHGEGARFQINTGGSYAHQFVEFRNINGKQFTVSGNGDVDARLFRANNESWGDYVFDNDYDLRPLSEVEKFIGEHNHLPDVPSEAEVLENGHDLGNMDKLLLVKIEELTLYIIDLNKTIEQQQKEIEQLKNKK